MNAEDLAKFNPGDKVRMTIETTLGDYAPSGSHVPVRLGVEHDVQTHIRADAIVSIERVRPELPDGWEWELGSGAAIYVDGSRCTVVCVWAGDEDGEVSVKTTLRVCTVPFAVIEAVRNA